MRNTGSYYIILMDDTEKSWKKRNVRDTENSGFTYLGHKISKRWEMEFIIVIYRRNQKITGFY